MRGDLQERPLLCFPSTKTPFLCQNDQKSRKIAHSDTKTPILCSKGRKMGVPKPKSAQKCRFCARRSTDQHGETQRGREKPPETGQDRLERSATARSTTKRNRHATNTTQRNTRNTTQHTQRNCNATQLHNGAQQKRRQPFGLSPLKIGGYLLSHMVVQYHRRK